MKQDVRAKAQESEAAVAELNAIVLPEPVPAAEITAGSLETL